MTFNQAHLSTDKRTFSILALLDFSGGTIDHSLQNYRVLIFLVRMLKHCHVTLAKECIF